MMENNSQYAVTHLNTSALHIIDDKIMDSEALMQAFTTRYQTQPGYMFLCRVYSQPAWCEDYNFCWWVITNEVAIRYQCKGDEENLFYWASQPEAKNITELVELHDLCPF